MEKRMVGPPVQQCFSFASTTRKAFVYERLNGPTCGPFGCGARLANVLGVLFRSAFRNTRGVGPMN